MRSIKKLLALLIAIFFIGNLAAQTASSASQPDRIEQLQQQVAEAKSNADNAWMLTASALVLMMTGPGLALFYGGLVRQKNVLSTMMHSFAMMAIITVLWGVVGFSLCFASGNSFIGGFSHVFLRGVGAQPDAAYAATIPLETFMIFQLMFAIITPALISGAFAERMKFSAMTLFMVLWSLIVYAAMAHMVWGKGGLLNSNLGGRFPTLDFAGGTVVHITSGVSALVCALGSGMIDGNYHQIVNQLAGVLIAVVLASIGTLVILKLVDLLIGLRVPAEQEIEGLDITQHGEEGYNWEGAAP